MARGGRGLWQQQQQRQQQQRHQGRRGARVEAPLPLESSGKTCSRMVYRASLRGCQWQLMQRGGGKGSRAAAHPQSARWGQCGRGGGTKREGASPPAVGHPQPPGSRAAREGGGQPQRKAPCGCTLHASQASVVAWSSCVEHKWAAGGRHFDFAQEGPLSLRLLMEKKCDSLVRKELWIYIVQEA